MKVALCFSGKLGDWDQCTDSILQNIILPFKPDIFLTTWDDENYQDFVQFYKPKKWITFNFEEKKEINVFGIHITTLYFFWYFLCLAK